MLRIEEQCRALVSTGAKGAAAPVNLEQRVHAPVNFQASYYRVTHKDPTLLF